MEGEHLRWKTPGSSKTPQPSTSVSPLNENNSSAFPRRVLQSSLLTTGDSQSHAKSQTLLRKQPAQSIQLALQGQETRCASEDPLHVPPFKPNVVLG